MAQMYPPFVSPDTRSPGEREIFTRLKDDPATRDWIILHSLNIADHLKQISGEIDFVIIIPQKGVLCLEVKAAQSIRRAGGLWYYGAKPEPDARGPFRQASEGMHSLRKRLIEKDPALSGIVFWSAVIFPYVEFSTVSPEWHEWQAIDSKQFRRLATSHIALNVLEKARAFLKGKAGVTWFDPAAKEPDLQQSKRILALLRPDFEIFEPPAVKLARLETELKRYTVEQYDALDAMSSNPRVFFDGPAGTGKTLIAIEAARRGHAEGRHVLLVCFNRLLGLWLRDQTLNLSSSVVTGTLHRHMLDVAKLEPPAQAGSDFWQRELPEKATERLIVDNRHDYLFDELIVDEAQDLLCAQYLDFLDLSLRGGLAAGRWRCFGDLERQAIFSGQHDIQRLIAERLNNSPHYSLRINCRNTPRIAELVHLLGGLSPRYSRVRRPDNGVEPEIKRYGTAHSQRRLLAKVLVDLRASGFAAKDIVVLSPLSEDACAARALGDSQSDLLAPFWNAGIADKTRYGSVHMFKGLEAPAVVVTDIETVRTEQAAALFYVAITRALERLIILVHENAGQEMLQIIAGLTTEQ